MRPLASVALSGGDEMAELTDKARKLFEGRNLLFVATVNQDGSPQVTPVWTHVENGNVTFNTAKGRVNEMIEGDEAEAQIDDLSEKYIGQRPYPWRRGEERIKVIVEPVRVHEM